MKNLTLFDTNDIIKDIEEKLLINFESKWLTQ